MSANWIAIKENQSIIYKVWGNFDYYLQMAKGSKVTF